MLYIICVSWGLFLFRSPFHYYIVIVKMITTIIIFYIGSIDKFLLSQSTTFNYITLLILHPIPLREGRLHGT